MFIPNYNFIKINMSSSHKNTKIPGILRFKLTKDHYYNLKQKALKPTQFLLSNLQFKELSDKKHKMCRIVVDTNSF